MKTRLLFGLLLPATVAVALFWWIREPADRPNILLITVDTLRANHLGLYGYERPTSPNLDAFADTAVVFDNAFTQATLSGPAHGTMMTGLYPQVHGAIDNLVPLNEGNRTLAELLRSAGYETAMFVSHRFVGPKYGFARGFDLAVVKSVRSHGPGHDHDGKGDAETNEIFEAVLEWLGQPKTTPFFAWLHVQHPHKSYDPPQPYDRMFVEPPDSSAHNLRCLYTLDDHRKGEVVLDEQEREFVVALYDGEIAFVDAELGRVFSELKRLGHDEKTIVVLTSDHGEMLFDDPWQRETGHWKHRFDPSLRIPLIVRAPGANQGGERVSAMVGLIDLAPTLLELVGVKGPVGFQGESLVRLLDGGETTIRERSYSCTYHSDGVTRLSVRTLRRKLICDKRRSEYDCLLFDLERDPDELRPVDGSDYDAEATELRAALEAWHDENVDRGKLLTLPPRSKRALKLLREAGYIEDDE